MKILVTGANGCIGRRLIPILLEQDHVLYACVRDASRFDLAGGRDRIHTIEVDFLDDSAPQSLPREMDVALYLIRTCAQMRTSSPSECCRCERKKLLDYYFCQWPRCRLECSTLPRIK